MDKYSISQKPTSGKKPAKKRAKAPKRRQSKSINPQLFLVAAVIVVALILGGVVWARYFNSNDDPASANGANKTGTNKSPQDTAVVRGEVFEAVTTAIGNKKPDDLTKYYAARVRVSIPKQGINKTLSAAQVGSLINNPLNTAQTPWNWQISPQDLEAWRNGPYGEYFVQPVIVGISADNTVIVIHLDENGLIDSILIIPVSDLTTPVPDAPPSSTTDNPTPDSAPVPIGSSTTDVSD